jgi:hypothetical protein
MRLHKIVEMRINHGTKLEIHFKSQKSPSRGAPNKGAEGQTKKSLLLPLRVNP